MNIGIRAKIVALASLGTFGLILVAILYHVGNSNQSIYQQRAEYSRKVYDRTKETLVLMLEARRAEKDFLLRKNRTYLERHAQSSKLIEANIKELKLSTSGAEFDDLHHIIEQIEAAYLVYEMNFQALADARVDLGLDENIGIEGEMRKSAHAIENTLADYDEPRVKLTLIMMRRHEKDFLLRHDENYISLFDHRAEEFIKVLELATIPSAAKKYANDTLVAYRNGFARLAEKTLEFDQLQLVVSGAYANVEPLAVAVSKVVDLNAHEAAAASEVNQIQTIKVMEISLLLSVLGVTLLGLLVGRSISRPLLVMTKAMLKLADGSFEIVLPGLDRQDEIGKMAGAVEVFKTKAIEKAHQEAQLQAEQERVRASERRTLMQKVAAEFESRVGKVVEAVSAAATELEATAKSLTQTVKTTGQRSTMVASASEKTSTNVAAIASATNEMSLSFEDIRKKMRNSNRMADGAVGQVAIIKHEMNELSGSADRVSDVTKLVVAIAKQTNMLALNATIEAARAGKNGSGFTVVAQEVKALATQTAQAISEIDEQIVAMQSATQDTGSAIKEISSTIIQMSGITSAIAAAVEEQSLSTSEIARNIQLACQGTGQIASSVADVKHDASDVAAAATQVLSSASSLAVEGDHLKTEMEKFLAVVRAA